MLPASQETEHLISDRIRRVLETLEMSAEILPIDPVYADTEAFCRHYGIPPERSANTIIVASKKEPKQFCACVILADSRLDVNRKVRQLMGVSRASFATADEMSALTGMEVGGVTPLGLPPGLTLYVDRRVMALPWVILGGGGRSAKVRISPGVFHELGATIVSDLGVSPAQPSGAATKS